MRDHKADRKAKRLKQEHDRAWHKVFDDYWRDNNQNADERWWVALEALQQCGDATGVITLVAVGVPTPDKVREEMALWLVGERPWFPGGLLDRDHKLWAAKRAYDEAPWLPDEKQDDKKERIAHEQARKLGLTKEAILNFLKHDGRDYGRFLAHQEWERAYLFPRRPKR